MKRKDGVQLKHADPMYLVATHIMAERNDACNSITLDIPLEPMNKYMAEKRKEGRPVSHLGIIMAAFVRANAEFPALNRFIVNKRVYARNHYCIGMVVMGHAKDGGVNEGTMSKVYFDLNDTIFDVERKMEEYVEKNRTAENSTEDLIQKLVSIPGLLRFGVNFFKWADKHNLLPKSVIEASPFHCSMVITNLASIRTNYIHHHVYNFGTVGMIVAAGNSREVPHTRGGQVITEKCIPLGVVMDERIASGSYYGKCFHRMKQFFANPALLEVPPEKVVADPEI